MFQSSHLDSLAFASLFHRVSVCRFCHLPVLTVMERAAAESLGSLWRPSGVCSRSGFCWRLSGCVGAAWPALWPRQDIKDGTAARGA